MRGVQLAAVSMLASASACFSPQAAECILECTSDAECPGSMTCEQASGLCRGSVASCAADPAGWWDAAWSARVPLTLSASFWDDEVELADFPLQVAIDDPQILTLVATGNGRDLRFVQDGVVLAHEVERFDGDSLRAWVRLPSLTRERATLHLYLGNEDAPAISNQVWEPDFLAVYHLAEDALLADSSASGFDGSSDSELDTDDGGPMAPGLRFDPEESTRVSLPAELAVSGAFTVEAWFTVDTPVEGILVGRDIHDPDEVAHDRGWVLDTNRDEQSNDQFGISFRMPWSATERSEIRVSDVLERGDWYYAAAVYEPNRETLLCYYPGECITEHFGDQTHYDNGYPVQIGAEAGDPYDQVFAGAIAEVRLSRVPRPRHYFQAVYENARPGSSMIEVGAVERRE